MLVHLCLEHTELVELGLGRHAQMAIALGTVQQACPKVGKLIDDTGIIGYGLGIVSHPVKQQGTVV